MSVRTDDPIAWAGATPSRSRHVAVVIAVALIVAALLWTSPAPPLVRVAGPVPVAFDGRAHALELPRWEGGVYVLGYDDGRYTTVSFPVVNRGLVPFELEAATLDAGPLPLAATMTASAGARGLPVRVQPGETVRVEVLVRFDHCDYYHEREAELIDGAVLQLRTLGRTVDVAVGFDRPIVVRAPMIVGCPDRQLDRTLRNRRDA